MCGYFPFIKTKKQNKMDNTLCRIRDLYRAIAEFESSFSKTYGISLNEGMLLCTLLDKGQQTSSEIADALGLSHSNASKVIRSVEDKDLITRQVGKEDKRQMNFILTAAGRELITRIKNTTYQLPELLAKAIRQTE